MRHDPDLHARFVSSVDAHQAAIRRIAAVYANDAADREDLTQEILLQLWRSFPSFRGDSSFSTFLYRVALNTALLRRRTASRKPRIESHRLESVVATPEEGDDEDVKRLYAAIRSLGPIDRAVVLLMLEGRSYEEIGAVTGLSTGAVGVRLTRARGRLAQLLGAENESRGESCATRT